MNISEEMAVKLHRMMWSDMQKELGDNPTHKERAQFKSAWIHKHFPDESIANDCWLCEYAASVTERESGSPYCKSCPIKWPNRHCNTLDFSYTKDPISDILALPAKNEKLVAEYVANDEAAVARSYYEYREQLLSKASGIPASLSIEDHVKAIREKAMQQSTFSVMYCEAKTELAKASGLPEADGIIAHIKAIQEKAIRESNLSKVYGDTKMELAKASGLPAADATTDHIAEIRKKEDRTAMKVLEKFSGLKGNGLWIVDHVKEIQEKAVEEKAEDVIYDFLYRCEKYPDIPINERLKKRLCAIQEKAVDDYFAKMPLAKAITTDVDEAFEQYAKEQKAPIFKELAEASGLGELCHNVSEHISAIRKISADKAAIDQLATDINTLKSITKLSYLTMEGFGSAFKQKLEDCNVLSSLLNKYKDRLCGLSGLDRDAVIDTHLDRIYDKGFAAGKGKTIEEMLKKIEEVLKA